MGRFEELGEALDLLFGKILNRNFNKADELLQKTEQELSAHKSSTQAHDATAIKYDGKVVGAGNTKQAIDNVQEQVNTLVLNGDSSPAAAQAAIDANGHDYKNLKLRLDTEHTQLSEQLADKASNDDLVEINQKVDDLDRVKADISTTMSKSEFDSWVATLLDGGPSIFYDTLAALEHDYPNGAAGVALVRETDPAKIYVWNGTEWADYGDYQGLEPKDGTISLDKLTADLRDNLNDLFSAFVEEGEFWSVNLFEATAVIQGGIGGGGVFTDSAIRTHIRSIKVKPTTDYYILIPYAQKLRIRNIASYENGVFREWLLEDSAQKSLFFKSPAGVNELAVSFCKEVTSEELTVQETTQELVIIIEVVPKPLNLINASLIRQGSPTGNGSEFSNSPTRTSAYPVAVKPLSIYQYKVDETSPVRIRNIALFSDGNFQEWLVADGVYTSGVIFIPADVTEIAISFCKVNINEALTVSETVNAPLTFKEVY